ncbi:hypothetical protein EV401DRAFT_1888382 [Pisolithus croceorrhizus]|nr:hypothetical protein EV401DRAFT_1888382 [Pisolithus croceorrhizus]
MATTGRGVSFSNNCFAVTSGRSGCRGRDGSSLELFCSRHATSKSGNYSMKSTGAPGDSTDSLSIDLGKSSATNCQDVQGRVSTFEYGASNSLNELPMAIGPINEAGNYSEELIPG